MAKEPLVYLRGEMRPASQAHIAIYDAAVILGATVTDLARTFRQKLYTLEDHIDRFYPLTRLHHGVSDEVGLLMDLPEMVPQDLIGDLTRRALHLLLQFPEGQGSIRRNCR